MSDDVREALAAWLVNNVEYDGSDTEMADALLASDAVARIKAEARTEAYRAAAEEMDRFADDAYGDDIFRRPTSEEYAEINALLKRERGHQLDRIAADCYHRAISVQAALLRDRAALDGADQ